MASELQALSFTLCAALLLVQGETVPYVICCEVDEEGNVVPPESKGLAERAYHPEEVKASAALRVDANWYLAQQVCVGVWVVGGGQAGLEGLAGGYRGHRKPPGWGLCGICLQHAECLGIHSPDEATLACTTYAGLSTPKCLSLHTHNP